MATIKTPQDVLSLCRQQDAKAVDFRFTDLLGTLQHTTISASQLDEDLFEDGIGFDGSSIRGWRSIQQSDMLLLPHAETAFIDPFATTKTINLTCTVHDPITRDPYTRDPRNIAMKAASFLNSTGIADKAFFGPEAEFFVFDNVRYECAPNESFYEVDSSEGQWNRARKEGNLGHQLRHKEGYFPCPPADQLSDLRSEMMQLLVDSGIHVECHHHEVATAGQCEIDLRYDELTRMADAMMTYKYIVKNVARRHNQSATFMPKPLGGDNGSGMHTHLSLWKDDLPLFAGSEYAGLSEMALHAIGGILKHAGALLALTNPTTNSYRRLVPGYEAPVNLCFGSRNRSAAIRIPMYSRSPVATRIEFRCPDPSCNPYLCFSALLMAVIDGINNRIDPGEPLDCNIYELSDQDAQSIPTTPANLEHALESLREDHEFLLAGDVFTQDCIDTWIRYKLENDVAAERLQPTPLEFCQYYDV